MMRGSPYLYVFICFTCLFVHMFLFSPHSSIYHHLGLIMKLRISSPVQMTKLEPSNFRALLLLHWIISLLELFMTEILLFLTSCQHILYLFFPPLIPHCHRWNYSISIFGRVCNITDRVNLCSKIEREDLYRRSSRNSVKRTPVVWIKKI